MEKHYQESLKTKFDHTRKIPEQATEYLSQKDISVLENGFKKLWEMLKNMEIGQLPTDIIFPEAAARPLFYAIKPLIKALYTQQKQPMPKFHFIVIHSKQRNLETIDSLQKECTESETDEETRENLNLMIEEEKRSLIIHNELRESTSLENVENLIYETEKALYTRVADVFRTGKERVLIIDDFVDKHTTKDLLKMAVLERADSLSYDENSSELVMPVFFAFYAKMKDSPEADGKTEETLDVISGSNENTPGLEEYSGFRYRNDASFNPQKSARYRKEVEATLGVKKYLGEKYVSRAENRDPEKMQALRNFLKYEGEKFVQKENT